MVEFCKPENYLQQCMLLFYELVQSWFGSTLAIYLYFPDPTQDEPASYEAALIQLQSKSVCRVLSRKPCVCLANKYFSLCTFDFASSYPQKFQIQKNELLSG